MRSIRIRFYFLIVFIITLAITVSSTLALFSVEKASKQFTELSNNTTLSLISGFVSAYEKSPNITQNLTRIFTQLSSQNDFFVILDSQGNPVILPEHLDLKPFFASAKTKQLLNQLIVFEDQCKTFCSLTSNLAIFDPDPESWVLRMSYYAPKKWFIFHAVRNTAIEKPELILFNKIILINSLILIFSLFISAFWLNRLTDPLKKLLHFTKDLPKNNFILPPDVKKSMEKMSHYPDEVGQLSKAFIDMESSLQHYINHLTLTTSSKERVDSELRIAKKIQKNLLPLPVPFNSENNFDIAAILASAHQIGGDWYDYGFIDNNRFYFVIGDVSDKGIPAAIFTASVKAFIHTMVKQKNDPGEVLTEVNNSLRIGNRLNMFATLFLGILNTSTGEIAYANAGHLPPIIIHQQTILSELPLSKNPIIGVFNDIKYQTQTLKLCSDDILFLYTDGVTELANGKNMLFGEKNLYLFLQDNSEINSPELLLQMLTTTLMDYAQGQSQTDDIAVIALHYFENENDFQWKTLPAKIDSIELFHQFIIETIQPLSPDKDKLFNIQLATEEALINVVSYAYREVAKGQIKVGVRLRSGSIEVKIIDDGAPFNPLELKMPPRPKTVEDLPNAGGFGCFLMRQYADKIDYHYIFNQNRLLLTFKI